MRLRALCGYQDTKIAPQMPRFPAARAVTRRRDPDRSRAAASVRYLGAGQPSLRLPIQLRCSVNDVRRQFRSGGTLLELDRQKIVAYVLFVEALLRMTRTVRIGRPETRGIRRQKFIDENESTVYKPEFHFCVCDDDSPFMGDSNSTIIDRERMRPDLLRDFFSDHRG